MDNLVAMKELMAEAMLSTLLEAETDSLSQMSWFCSEEESFEESRQAAA